MRHLRSIPLLAFWLAFLVWSAAVPLRGQTADQRITLADYYAELIAAIVMLEDVPNAKVAETLQSLQTHFATITQVEMGDEVVEMRSILDSLDVTDIEGLDQSDPLRQSSPKEIALARLRGALAQINAAATDNTAARLAILADILARPAFNAPQSLWDRFWQWLERLFNDLLPNAQAGARAGWLAWLIRLVPWISATLIVAAIIALLSYWLQRLLAAFVTDARIAVVAGDDDMPSTAAEARQQARAAAESGLYRDAVRRLYLAALLQLAEHDLITYERSLTNREVLVRVPSTSPIRTHLERIVATFDQVWYGVREPDQATFTAYEREIDTLATLAARATRTPGSQGDA